MLKSQIALVVFSFLATSLFAGSAFADKCKDVSITVKNAGKKEIKVKSMSYEAKVDNKERKEGLKNKTVKPGKSVNLGKQNLPGIKGYKMKYIKLEYQVKCGGKWSKAKTQKHSKFKKPQCVNGGNYTVKITKTGC